MKPTLCLAALLLMIAVPVLMMAIPAMADSGAAITDIEIIPLHQGVNDFAQLEPGGRAGQIVKTWRENGNAQGYNLFLVMLENKVIGIDHGNHFDDYVRDNPHTIEDAIKSVRFAYGKVGDDRALLLITATRDLKPDTGPNDPTPVIFDIYRLTANGSLGTTGDFFAPVNEFKSKTKYCNADLALNQNLGLPLPSPFEGPNQADGCL